MDPGLAPRSYETVPVAVGRGGGRGPSFVVALVVVFVGLAIVKPWGGGPGPAPDATAVPAASASPSRSSSDPAAASPSLLAVTVPASPILRPTGPLADALAAARAIAGSPAVIVGRWGVAAAGRSGSIGTPGGASDMRAWTSWQPAQTIAWDARTVVLGAIDAERICAAGPRLPAGPLALAMTAPENIRPDWVVSGWLVAADGVSVLGPSVVRLPADPAHRFGLSILVFADGSEWADGVYRFEVRSGASRVAIDLCVGSVGTLRGGPRPIHPPTGGGRTPSDLLFGPLVARLAAYSGAWGIGSSGWGISPVSGEPWAGWESVAPVPSEQGPSHRVAPTCEDLDWLRVGIIVAVTVPPGLAPDWTVSVQRFDAAAVPLDAFVARQVSPPGNRGISYLVRPDDSQWRSGAYRFTITTATRSLVLDACLIAL